MSLILEIPDAASGALRSDTSPLIGFFIADGLNQHAITAADELPGV